MEEGPEPQEWVERAAEEHHHGHGEGGDGHEKATGQPTTVAAITAAVLAVLAAVGSLLSGHAANQAILAMTRATDQWALFQAKSTKGHMYEVAGELVSVLGEGGGSGPGSAAATAVERFRAEAKRYDGEKGEVGHEAEALEAESRHEFQKHQRYALGVASFQVGIVLASVYILVRHRALYALSLVAGLGGLVCLVLGLAA
jgi:hypothetical protein